MTDWQVALVTAVGVALFFALMMFAQRRQALVLTAAVSAQAPTPDVGLQTEGLTTEGQTKAGFDGISERFEAFGKRLEKMETSHATTLHDVKNIRAALAGLPSKDAVHRLEVELTKTAGRVETVEVVVNASQRSLERIEDHLMSGGKS